jgi:hypothetical protein
MKRPARDSLIALGLLALLAALTVLAAVQRPAGDAALPPLASISARPDGAKALRLWLADLGYAVDDRLQSAFQPPDDAAVALVLEPVFSVVTQEFAALEQWVEGGGLLVVAGDGIGAGSLLRRFGFQLAPLDAASDTPALPQTPLWTSPPLVAAEPRARYHLQSARSDFVTHLAVAGRPVVVSFPLGEGRVILSSSARPFSNAGLRSPGNAALALNVASAGSRSGAIWFDEWHHGLRDTPEEQIAGPGQWLRRTRAGQGVLLFAGLLFAALVLRGRHFGPSLPLPASASRRAPLEYLTAVAQLGRRAGHRRAMLRQYRHWLKRSLGARYRLDSTLPDDDYVARLASYNPALDAASLRSLLARLDQPNPSEADLVALAAEAARWTDR